VRFFTQRNKKIVNYSVYNNINLTSHRFFCFCYRLFMALKAAGGSIMKLKLLLAAALAFVFVSCGGTGGNAAEKKKAAATSLSAITAFGPAIFGSIGAASKAIRTQATVTEPLTCSPGSGTVSFTDSPTSFSITLTSTSGCTSSGTKITTGTSGFTLGVTASGNFETSFSITMTFNGTISITEGGVTQSLTYTNLVFTLAMNNSNPANPTGSITISGAVTVDGQTQTFNNESYSFADLN
jgi:hypothetical protein